MLTRARYARLGGAAAILSEPSRERNVPAAAMPPRRTWWAIAAVAAVAMVAAIAIATIRSAGPPDAPVSPRPTSMAGTPMPMSRPTLVVGGSGTVLWGFLEPVRDVLERRSDVSIPLTRTLDTGSGGAIRLLKSGDVELVGLSARYDREVPTELRTADKLLVEVAIGFDEVALFVRHDNPLRRVDIAAVRRVLCCARGEDTRGSTWSALGVTTAPLSAQPVRWILFGRNSTPRPGDSRSATLVQADRWFCADAQLCAASEPVEGEAHEILLLLQRMPNALALSSRSFATPAVHRVEAVDRDRGTRLNGRKTLWLYFAADRGRPIPAKLCRFLAAVLDAETGKKLDEIGKADGLPSLLRSRQRSALGLDDGACAIRAVTELVGDPEDGIARSPLSHELEVVERWIPDAR
jgi:hypothetical protein